MGGRDKIHRDLDQYPTTSLISHLSALRVKFHFNLCQQHQRKDKLIENEQVPANGPGGAGGERTEGESRGQGAGEGMEG